MAGKTIVRTRGQNEEIAERNKTVAYAALPAGAAIAFAQLFATLINVDWKKGAPAVWDAPHRDVFNAELRIEHFADMLRDYIMGRDGSNDMVDMLEMSRGAYGSLIRMGNNELALAIIDRMAQAFDSLA